MSQTKKGFSLVELMLVVAIIALMAAIAIPNIIRNRIASNEASAQASLKTISTALENYASVFNAYPSATNTLLTATPPYLSKDYFTGVHNGYTFTASLSSYTYSIVAQPISSNHGITNYTITTGSVLSEN